MKGHLDSMTVEEVTTESVALVAVCGGSVDTDSVWDGGRRTSSPSGSIIYLEAAIRLPLHSAHLLRASSPPPPLIHFMGEAAASCCNYSKSISDPTLNEREEGWGVIHSFLDGLS